jgi:putative transposase
MYNWKAKYGDLDMSGAKGLRTLEDENRNLKKLLAESMLDNAALKELLSKKWQGPSPSAWLWLICVACWR